jgi:outer membrane biosynthesis protein TonB
VTARPMKIGLIVSTVLHAVVLLWGLITFAPRPFQAAAQDSMPVDIISVSDFTKMVSGAPNAPKAEAPKRLVEKIGEAKPVEHPVAKVVDNKREIVPTADKQTPPEPKPEPKREPERKQAVAKADPIAEALKKDEAKPESKKKEEAKAPTPHPPKPQPKFDATKIAAFLDKSDPQRQAALGDFINHTPALGAPKGTAMTLSLSEKDALARQIQRCWNPPAGAADARDLRVEFNMKLRIDGSLAAEPVLLERSNGPYAQAFAESALRAVQRCQPYTVLPAAKYEVWKDIDLGFTLEDMFGR